MPDFHRTLVELLEDGRPCATATLVDATGSTPAKAGHRMIVFPDGSIRFTMGGGPLEALVIADAVEHLKAGGNAVHSYRLVPEGEDATGMVCGGTARVFIEVHTPAPRLLIFGAGHVGRALARMAQGLGFSRTVADDRPTYLQELDPGVETILCAEGFTGELPRLDPRTYAVVVTRCHRTDGEILSRLAGGPAPYLGMIGSLRKVATVRRKLEARGVPAAHLDAVRAPVGLEIGARLPAEIAVAILAEIVAVRRGAALPLRQAKVQATIG